MNEDNWLTYRSPSALIAAIRRHKNIKDVRRWRLLSCALVRQYWDVLTDDKTREAIQGAEQVADGRGRLRLRELYFQAERAYLSNRSTAAGGCLSVYAAASMAIRSRSANMTRSLLMELWRSDLPMPPVLVDLVRDVIYNPFLPKPPPVPASAQILDVAQSAYGDRTPDTGYLYPDRLAVLADTLEEAGCVSDQCRYCLGKGCIRDGDKSHVVYPADESWNGCDHGRVPHPVLVHLRSPGPHVRGCWALDEVLGEAKRYPLTR